MTITHRKRSHLPDEIQVVNEPGLQIQCDNCGCDLTHSIRIKCAASVCEEDDGIDICPACFCAGKEFKMHKRGHPYRVVELHSYPIFAEDWGADEELLLIEGISLQGLGNWQAVAEHVGTRTSKEVEEHYYNVYINSPDWPLPRMDLKFDVDPSLFHERKRRRIQNMNQTPSVPKVAPTSAPGVHEVATFLPGRLEFEHELDNEAEDLVKDLEFGMVMEYGGERLPLDENDVDVKARIKLDEEKRKGKVRDSSVDSGVAATPLVNGHDGMNGHSDGVNKPGKLVKDEGQEVAEPDPNAEEPVLPPPYESRDSIQFKLTLLEMYDQRVEKRAENKLFMFDRGLLEHRKMLANEKKRPKDEKEIAQRLRPLAKLQTAEDYETFVEGIIYESILRKRIQELQHYRRMGLTTAADIERYEADVAKRQQVKAQLLTSHADRLQLRAGGNRGSTGPDGRRASVISGDSEAVDPPLRTNAPGSHPGAPLFRRPPAPLNLANSPSLHLLTPAEQVLCSTQRIQPKPYLVIKETLIREYAKRGGKLRRREARDLVKIDVNKTSKIWDFLCEAGYLKAALESEPQNIDTPPNGNSNTVNAQGLPKKDSNLPLQQLTFNPHGNLTSSESELTKPNPSQHTSFLFSSSNSQ